MSRAGLEVAGSYPAPPSTASGLRRLPRGTPHTGHLPPRQARRCRRRFRTTTTVRTEAPSLGSTRTLRPERARLRILFACTASPRTLSLAASLGLPRQRPAGRLELPRSVLCAAFRRRSGAGKMRLTDFCNRLPSRAPCGLLGSWLRPLPRPTSRCLVAPRVPHGPRRRNAGSPWASARRWRGSGACRSACRTSRPSGASLDGEASCFGHSPQSSRDPRRGALRRALRELGPERPRERHSTVLAGPRSPAPPRCTSRLRCFRPRAELATLPLTPSVATLRGSGRETGSPSLRIARPASTAVSSKTTACVGPGRLPSTSAPSPGRAPRFRAIRVGSRGARHRCRCSRARGFRHRDPASGALSPLELPPAQTAGARGLDPRPFGWTKRRSSTSATKHSPRARPRNRLSPASRWNERALTHIARRLRHGGAAGCAGELYPSLSARASHDDDSHHLEGGWYPRAGSHARCVLRRGVPFGRALAGLRGTSPDEAFAPSDGSTGETPT
jgi:hypothetical protein